MESSLRKGKIERAHQAGAGSTIEVEVVTPRVVAERCKLPKRFGVLSIDAEGVGDMVRRRIVIG